MNMNNNFGFDVPGVPGEQDDAQNDEQAATALRGLPQPQPQIAQSANGPFTPDRAAFRGINQFTVEGGFSGARSIPAQDLTVPDEVASRLPDDTEPLPSDLASALAELTYLDNLNVTGKAEYLRRRRRNAVAKIAFDLQNGSPAPGPIMANEQAAQRNNDPFAAAEQRLAELAAKHSELTGKV